MNEEDHIDHEAELVVRLGGDLRPEAMCIGCDTTNRTRQTIAKNKRWPWTEGKAFRGSGVLGTWTPYQEGVMQVTMKINGETRQDAPTSLMIHSVDELVEHLSSWYELSPGDFVWTGTPSGVGRMYTGDVVEAYLTNEEGEVLSTLDAICRVG